MGLVIDGLAIHFMLYEKNATSLKYHLSVPNEFEHYGVNELSEEN